MTWEIRQGDALERLREMPDESVQCCVTSPPYWGLRDYGVEDQLGLEETPREFVDAMVEVFGEVRRVLRSDGTLWLNIGDSYAGGGCGSRDPRRWPKQSRNDHMPRHAKRRHGIKPKDLIGVPWMLAFGLREDGWYLRAENIWHKLTPMPESVQDRTTRSHEQVFLLSKSPRYFYDADAVRTPLAEKTLTTFGSARKAKGGGDLVKQDNWARDVPNREAKRGEDGEPVGAPTCGRSGHSPRRRIRTLTSPPSRLTLSNPASWPAHRGGAVVLDPFAGAATTGLVATRLNRDFIGIELNPEYVELGRRRIQDDAPLLNTPAEVAA